ncbi:hypothetical protein HHK36_008777 [Tetracentron sinense]|uniref:Uncharacterized protein n=1 Tax=Tetracentron sinense TaxID=13715 RepID=A0A834ZN77_TETSI|nr:hypothetical protein HHK36_008777 [Tetracentron sinense]
MRKGERSPLALTVTFAAALQTEVERRTDLAAAEAAGMVERWIYFWTKMTGSSALPGIHYHVRSISLPSRLHPSTLRIEEELNKLRTSEISSAKAETIKIGLAGIEKLYNCVDDLIHLPLTQQALVHHKHERLVEEVLDGSVSLLDVCGTARDILLMMSERVQDLQSALRSRSGRDSSMESKVGAYICFRKKVKKDIGKCLGELKRMGSKFGLSSLIELDHHLSVVVKVLREVTMITISIFQSLLMFMSAPSKLKPGRWSLISKLVHAESIANCEGRQEHINEVENVDVALYSLHGGIRNKDAKVNLQTAQKSLETLEISIGGLETGLECMFRRLIQTRVTLLNIISH